MMKKGLKKNKLYVLIFIIFIVVIVLIAGTIIFINSNKKAIIIQQNGLLNSVKDFVSFKWLIQEFRTLSSESEGGSDDYCEDDSDCAGFGESSSNECMMGYCEAGECSTKPVNDNTRCGDGWIDSENPFCNGYDLIKTWEKHYYNFCISGQCSGVNYDFKMNTEKCQECWGCKTNPPCIPDPSMLGKKCSTGVCNDKGECVECNHDYDCGANDCEGNVFVKNTCGYFEGSVNSCIKETDDCSRLDETKTIEFNGVWITQGGYDCGGWIKLNPPGTITKFFRVTYEGRCSTSDGCKQIETKRDQIAVIFNPPLIENSLCMVSISECGDKTCLSFSEPVGATSETSSTSIYMIRDKNNPSFNGLAYVITPHVNFSKNVIVSMNYSGLSENMETYMNHDHESVMQSCSYDLINNISMQIGSNGGKISLERINMNIPSGALNSNINFKIEKYNLHDCIGINSTNETINLNINHSSCSVYCGDGECNSNENCENCARDCGICTAMCGNSKCEDGESIENCLSDCGGNCIISNETTADACQNKNCNDNNECTDDSCSNGVCINKNNNNPCTINEGLASIGLFASFRPFLETLSLGSSADGTCHDGICIKNCIPKDSCEDNDCGDIDDGCGGIISCDDCNSDNDGDGYFNIDVLGDDCDDNNNGINPGVEEICEDGVDNNCDGEIDEGCGSCNYDGMCDEGEDENYCPSDCWSCNSDGVCDNNNGENCNNCENDCGFCSLCGDGVCDESIGENVQSCINDCGYCGDGSCYNGELCSSCSVDCGSCPTPWIVKR